MENIFYGDRELGVFVSNKELEELKNSGSISENLKGKNLEVKIFENENNTSSVQLNPAGKDISEANDIELYIDESFYKKLEREGTIRGNYGVNEIIIYSEKYAYLDALDQVYNLRD